MNRLNEKNLLLIRDLIAFLPKYLGQFGDQLMSDKIISESIVSLRHDIEEYVDKEVVKLFSNPNVSTHELIPETDHKSTEICLKCEVILDKMWETINCCDWSGVHIQFRLCFGFVSLLKAILEIRSVVKSIDPELVLRTKLSALKTLDFGLLMSPKLTDSNILAKFAKLIHQSIDKSLNPNKKVRRSDQNNEDSNQRTSTQTKSTNNGFQRFIPYFKNDFKHQIKRVKDLDLDDFRDQYLVTKTPVIITDCMDDWPALTHHKWSVDYIESVAAYRTVPIEIGSKYTGEEWSQKLMTIKEFINQFILSSGQRTGYLAQHNLFDQIEELMEDICVPDYCSVSADLDSESVDIDINGWFGPAATVSPLHYDPKDNLLAQVFGEKYVRLYSDETPSEDIYPNDCRLLSNTSAVDLENVDSVKFPNFERIENYWECLLKEGEILFIPKKYWHFVKSLSTSFSVSFWWK